MSKIYITGVPGRVARISPQGRYVPHDGPAIPARLTPYLQRRIDAGDVKIADAPKKAQAPASPPAKQPADSKPNKE